MPVKNGGQFIKESIDSILYQNYPQWELLVIDDKSIDDTALIIKNFAHHDSRIRYYFNNVGDGIIDALKLGLNNATGEYVTRLDADDIMPKNRLALMVIKLSGLPPKTIVTGMVRYFPRHLVSRGYLKYEEWINETNRENWQWKRIYRECVVASSNWMARLGEMVEIDLFENLEYPEDYHIVFKWYLHNFNIVSLDQTTLLWRRRKDSISKTHVGFQQKSFFKMKIAHFLKLDHNGEEIVIWGKNNKSKLVSKILEDNDVVFCQHDLANYKHIEAKRNFKLLVAVYPSKSQRDILESYLDSLNLREGECWWYL